MVLVRTIIRVEVGGCKSGVPLSRFLNQRCKINAADVRQKPARAVTGRLHCRRCARRDVGDLWRWLCLSPCSRRSPMPSCRVAAGPSLSVAPIGVLPRVPYARGRESHVQGYRRVHLRTEVRRDSRRRRDAVFSRRTVELTGARRATVILSEAKDLQP